jgi:hypothetical protein
MSICISLYAMSGSVWTSDRISAKVISATIVPFMLLRHVAVRMPPLRTTLKP